ncbi:MAG: hypothetical protein K2X66_18120, partial [Cyanobacteria bacterium]|nr:hypothetical protein [Cyanobacteriota bacterium]
YAQALAILQQMLAAYNALSSTAQSIVNNAIPGLIAAQIGAQIASIQQMLNQQIGNGINSVVQIVTSPTEPENIQAVGPIP